MQTDIATSYLDYLAKSFPVMCASDEFHFLPRAEKASHYYHSLDDLDEATLAECISRVLEYRNAFEREKARQEDLEKITDMAMLQSSAEGFLVEFKVKQSWRYNPLLYLKTAFIGLDQALTKPASESEEKIERASARLGAIPRILQQATNNLDRIPKTYHQASRAMAADCEAYLRDLGRHFITPTGGLREESLESALTAVRTFAEHIDALPARADQEFPLSSLKATVESHFLSSRSLSDIFEIGQEEWRQSLEQIDKLKRNIDAGSSWQELYHTYTPSDLEETDTLTLYQEEAVKLHRFFREEGFTTSLDSGLALELCETPTYLRSVRSGASFSAALRAGAGEKDLFYITTRLPARHGEEAGNLLRKRLHREYRFLSAHETIPGHHLLDEVRRRLTNPVRRQVESPLFYEGWAYYAESLLTEYGYVDSPLECLVDTKRSLWRAARCQIDVGLPTGRLTREGAIDLITTVGFSPQEANIQIDRFRLNPGYQLCYTLGRYEIIRLRELYGPQLGRDEFHRELLAGGERPFDLIEKDFKARMGDRA